MVNISRNANDMTQLSVWPCVLNIMEFLCTVFKSIDIAPPKGSGRPLQNNTIQHPRNCMLQVDLSFALLFRLHIKKVAPCSIKMCIIVWVVNKAFRDCTE